MSNKIYVNDETALLFADAAQTPDVQFTLQNLAAGAGRISAVKDFTDSAHSEWFKWRLTVQFETAPVVGQALELWMATADSTTEDGEEGVADAALGSYNSTKNMKLIGLLIVTSTDPAHDMTASGVCRIPDRYASFVLFNDTDDNIANSNTASRLTLTPIPPEIQ